MTFKHLKFAIIGLFLSISSIANANLIYDLEIEFESGGTFLGQIEFSDPTRATAITGVVTGGTQNYNEAITWVWTEGTSQLTPFDGEWYFDWFMNNDNFTYTAWFGLAWKVNGSSILFSQAPYQESPTFSGGIFQNDNITSVVKQTKVSEPSTLAIIVLGVIAIASRRFRNR